MLNEDTGKLNMKWYVSVPPTLEPVSVDEVKEFARIDGTEEDLLLGSIIESCRHTLEDFLGRAFMQQTIILTFDLWNERKILLPKPPLVSVTSVVTIDEEGTETTYDSDNYYVHTQAIPGELIIKREVSMPTNYDRDYEGFKITYVAGFGTNPENVPKPIRQALLTFVTEVYEYRVPEDVVPMDVLKQINHLRVRWRYDT